VPYREQKEFMVDLKKIYQALTIEEAELAFVSFKEKWGKRHPIIIRSWENNWVELTAYFKYTRSAGLFIQPMSSRVTTGSYEK